MIRRLFRARSSAITAVAACAVVLGGASGAAAAGAAGAPSPCGADGVCRVVAGGWDRTYRIRLPMAGPGGWDGVSALPVLLHFHGRYRNAAHVLKNSKLTKAADQFGVALVAADGIEGDWSVAKAANRDVLLADAIAADLPKRVAIDPRRIILSGFSNGGAVVSRIACDRGGAFAGYLPIAGHLRPKHEQDCIGGARVLQVHGLKDAVYPVPLGPDRAAASDDFPFWRLANRTAAEPVDRIKRHIYRCRWWRGADGDRGAEVGLCLHRFGHIQPRSWFPLALERLIGRPTRL